MIKLSSNSYRYMLQMARSKKACIVFFDEADAIGGARFDDGVGGDNEVQRTMLEIVNQLDGFDARGNIKVLMATNRLVKLPIMAIFLLDVGTFQALSEPLFSILK